MGAKSHLAGLEPVLLKQLQPDFADGGVGEHGVPEPVQRHFANDGDGGGMQQLGHVRASEGGAQQHLAVLVDHQLGPALIAFGVQRGSGHLDGQFHGGHPEAVLFRLPHGPAYIGQFRIGEHHVGHRVVVRGPGVTAPRGGLTAELAPGPGSDRVASGAGAVFTLVRQHDLPCGVARGGSLREAYLRAFDCDRTSAFGGIIALNQPLDGETAEEIAQIFTEVVIAPGADDRAKEIFAKKKNLRLLTTDGLADPKTAILSYRQVSGGLLVQDKDNGRIDMDDLKVVTKRAPSEKEMADLLFAWTVAKHVKSNAIVYVKDGATVGVGAGQMSRVDSSTIAALKAERMAEEIGLPETPAKGSVVASDAFFPFADGLLAAANAGATAVIQPGGSMRDDEVIKAADEAGLAMVLTGMRHFRH